MDCHDRLAPHHATPPDRGTAMSQIQPADFESADYRTVLRRLTTLDDEAAAMRAEAVRWHDERGAAADEAVRAAHEAMLAAEEAARQAQKEYEQVDAKVAQLWSDYVHKIGTGVA